MKARHLLFLALLVAVTACGHRLKDGHYTLQVLSTNDVHGTWFDSTYVDNGTRNSLFAMKYYIDSIRTAFGPENVVLVDAGDCLQGDNAAYYYNYVDTVTPHLFPRLMSYMKYDAVAVGNHDIETGHPVYDRVAADLKKAGIPFLGGNAIRNDNGQPYFPLYKMIKRAGLRIAIVGYTNANIKAWLGEELWSGITFKPIIDLVQKDIDQIREKEKPDVVLVVVHSASGQGDGSVLEAEGLDIFNSVHGIDFLICSHEKRKAACLLVGLLQIRSETEGLLRIPEVLGKQKNTAEMIFRNAFTDLVIEFCDIHLLTLVIRILHCQILSLCIRFFLPDPERRHEHLSDLLLQCHPCQNLLNFRIRAGVRSLRGILCRRRLFGFLCRRF